MDTRRDAYLGGKVHITQPATGYRAGIDPVILAAACPARPGHHVLDLGCGVGTAGLCLQARVPGVQLWGLERQPSIAALARENACGTSMQIIEGDLSAMPEALRALSFDHVIANPPYFLRSRGAQGPDAAREHAMGEDTPLNDWVSAARKRLRPKGWLTMIHRAERLQDLMVALQDGFGSLQILPLLPRDGRKARLMVVQARKGGQGDLQLLAPEILHSGTQHLRDEDDYSPLFSSILRDGAGLKRLLEPH